ncbi:MAG: molybdopterin-dependent oxidoreductase [Anaerolineae bacterium]
MPQITRRRFLQATALGTAAFVMAGCSVERRVRLEPYVVPPEDQVAGVASWYASTCRMCPAGCGIIVRVLNGRALKIEGNQEHPLNQGKLCARGQAGPQLLYNPDRLSGPQASATRGSKNWQQPKWDDALKTLASQIQGAGSGVAAWVGSTTSGHVYDLFSRLTQAAGGPAPLVFDLYTGLHGYRTLADVQNGVFGTNNLPAYDLTTADVILSFGSNILSASTSQVRYGMDYGKFRSQPLGKRGYLVQFEPRRSLTGAKADRWFAIRPGTEGLVAQALIRLIADRNPNGDRGNRARVLAGNIDPLTAANTAGVSLNELYKLADLFANSNRPVAIAGTFTTGQDKARDALSAIHALNLVAGGGQPGNMVSQAPVPSDVVKPAPGSFADAQKLISQMKSGAIKVLMVHNANPAYDLPPAFGFADALKNVPFVVSFASIMDETSAMADLILPDRTYLEAWGYEVVSPNFGMPTVSSQQPVVSPYPDFDTRATGDVLLQVAKNIPAAASQMSWTDEVAFIKDTITKLPPGAAGGASPDVLWARFQQHGGWWPTKAPAAPAPQAKLTSALSVTPPTYQGNESDFPYFLHLYLSDLLSDGRGASIPWLQGAPDPMTTVSWQTWVEIHPNTAKKLGVQDEDIVKVTSPAGEIQAIVYTFPVIREDTVAIPLGQGHTEYGRYAANRGSNAMKLVGPETGASGNVNWQTLRVKITKTGQTARLARFESAIGMQLGEPGADVLPFPTSYKE